MDQNNMDLRALLELLPSLAEDGTYFELRKHDSWLCAETNMRTNKDHCSNTGRTPEEAVLKMLVRKNLVIGCGNCFHAGVDHVQSGGCVFCQCVRYEGEPVIPADVDVPMGKSATTADMEAMRARRLP